jgi:hypothetical protein
VSAPFSEAERAAFRAADELVLAARSPGTGRAAGRLLAVEHEMRNGYAALVAERKAVATAHASEAEVLASLARLVGEAADGWAKRFGGSIVR